MGDYGCSNKQNGAAGFWVKKLFVCFFPIPAAVRSWLIRRKVRRWDEAAAVIQNTWRKWRVRFFFFKLNKAVKIEKITKQNIYTQVAFHINLISIIVFLKTSERP